jgi:hypothetical protein
MLVVTLPLYASGNLTISHAIIQTCELISHFCFYCFTMATKHQLYAARLCNSWKPNTSWLHAPSLASSSTYGRMQCRETKKRTKHALTEQKMEMEMLLRRVSDPASAWKVGGVQGGHITGAAGPVMCCLSAWTLLITAPEAVVGRLLGSVSPGTRVDRCGRATSVPCDAPTLLWDA